MNKILIALIPIIGIFFSCNDSDKYKVHEKGFEYKILTDVENAVQVKDSDILEIDVKYYSNLDSLLFNSNDIEEKFRIQVLDAQEGGIFQDAVKMLKVGDSAHFLIPAGDFYSKTARGQRPDFVAIDEKLRFEIKVKSLQSPEELQKEMDAIMKKKEAEEKQILSEYLTTEGITLEPTESGLYVIQLERGKGKKAEAGKKAVVHYKGLLLNGQQFDSSIDRDEPFEFVIGNAEVIPAWDEAVAGMKVGDKIKIIAPSNLAYGARGAGVVIPPFSSLVFEIKLLDIKDNQ